MKLSDHAVIIDPAQGRRRLSAAEFESSFGGTALLFKPGPSFDLRTQHRASQPLHYMKQILHAPGAPRILAWILAASVFLQAFGFALPLFTKLLVDRILPIKSMSELNMLFIGGVMAAVMNAVMAYLRAVLLVRLEARLDSPHAGNPAQVSCAPACVNGCGR